MKIISFSPYSSAWEITLTDALIAKELQKNHEVTRITAGNALKDRSVCLSMFGLNAFSNKLDKFLVEKLGMVNEKTIRDKFKLNEYEIKKFINEQEEKEIGNLMSDLDRSNFLDFSIGGINLGRIALYELLLNHKKISFDFTEEEWLEYRISLKNCLYSYFSCKKIIETENPDVILVYNALYSLNHVWQKYASQNGVKVYFMHAGLNFSDMQNSLIIAKNNSVFYFNELKTLWEKFKYIPCSDDMINYVTDHFIELFRGRNLLVYSTPKSKERVSVRNTFNINKNQKILTATMSSYDELFAAENVGARESLKDLVFENQIEWIKALIDFIKGRKDLFLIIRVHPREFPNRRDNVKSQHSLELKNAITDLPDNIVINWPTDNISVYDLAQETDVFLNGWSSTGIEMSLLGIPVVIYSKDLINYPAELNYLASDRKDYFNKIEKALEDGWSFQRMKNTYRWLSLYYYRPIIRLGGKKSLGGNDPEISIIKRIYGKLPQKIKFYIKMVALLTGKKQRRECDSRLASPIDITRVEKMLIEHENTLVGESDADINNVTEMQEDEFIKMGVKRLYEILYGGQSADTNDGRLELKLRRLINNIKD